jgi:predicted AAA+ superfamily ATPase
MEFVKATDPDSAIRACKPFPLTDPGDPRYVDFSEQYGLCRGKKNRLVDALKPTNNPPSRHMVLAGPGGSGKSTLVLQSFEKFESEGLYPVHIDVLEMLDPGSIQYSDLLVAMVARCWASR